MQQNIADSEIKLANLYTLEEKSAYYEIEATEKENLAKIHEKEYNKAR
jgi:hypothetical protein